MLIVREPLESQEVPSITVLQTGVGFQLRGHHAATEKDWDFEFDFTKVAQRPDIASLLIDRAGNPQLIWTSEVVNDRVAMAHALNRANVVEYAPIAIFAVEQDGEGHCVTVGVKVLTEIQCVRAPASNMPIDLLREHVPALKPFLKAASAKRALLAKVSTTDSLSALEKQVDLLTRLVLDLVERQSPPMTVQAALALKEILSMADANGASPASDVVQQVLPFKARLRQAQSKYFSERE